MSRRHFSLGIAGVIALAGTVFAAAPAQASAVGVEITQVTTAPVVAGKKVEFSGTAPKSLKGGFVSLVRLGKKSASVGHAIVERDGTFSVKGAPAGVGTNRFVVKVTLGNKTVTSNTVATTVYSWFSVTGLQQPKTGDGYSVPGGYGRGWLKDPGLKINGKTYATSFERSGDYYGTANTFVLEGACLTFRGYLGVDDSDTTHETWTFTLGTSDDNQNFSVVDLGTATNRQDGALVTQDLGGAWYLGLGMTTDINTTSGSGGAIGNPQVLCSANPYNF